MTPYRFSKVKLKKNPVELKGELVILTTLATRDPQLEDFRVTVFQ